MRFLPQHPPFWPFFTKWMEKLVPRKHGLACKGTGPSNEREKNAFGGGKGSGSSIVSATHSAISGPIQTSSLSSLDFERLLAEELMARRTKGELVGEI